MMLNVKEVAKLLNVPEKKVYHLIAQNNVPVYKIGEEYQFNRVELIEWATSMGIRVSSETYHEHDMSDSSKSVSFYDALKAGSIMYNVQGNDKPTVLRNVVNSLKLPGSVDPEFMYQVLIAREKLGSTGIGDGIAIPHVRNPVILNVNKPVVTLSFLEKPIEFESIDGLPVTTLFTLVCPTIRVHLHLLAKLGFVLQNAEFKSVIQSKEQPEIIFKTLKIVESAVPAVHDNPASEDANELL